MNRILQNVYLKTYTTKRIQKTFTTKRIPVYVQQDECQNDNQNETSADLFLETYGSLDDWQTRMALAYIQRQRERGRGEEYKNKNTPI